MPMFAGRTLYQVFVPEAGSVLFRLSETDSPAAFRSNYDTGTRRMSAEDAAMYRGFSALDNEPLARAYAERFDAQRRAGGPPRWSVIIEFELDGRRGEVCADTRTPGHFTVWGEPNELYSRKKRVLPI